MVADTIRHFPGYDLPPPRSNSYKLAKLELTAIGPYEKACKRLDVAFTGDKFTDTKETDLSASLPTATITDLQKGHTHSAHLQQSNDGRVCPRRICNWPITHSPKFHNRPVQPILISSLNPTQYVMVLTPCDYISAAPRLRPNPGGMGRRTYPNRQFRADPIVDLGIPARKTRGDDI